VQDLIETMKDTRGCAGPLSGIGFPFSEIRLALEEFSAPSSRRALRGMSYRSA
jgi:hypothetical protein